MADFSLETLRALLKNKMGAERYSPQIDRALRLAFAGHRGQFREHFDRNAEKVPYIVHPVGAALLAVELLPLINLEENFDDIISASLTHDLLEDTNVSISTLEKETSKRAASIVVALTKPTVNSSTARTDRNRAFVQQIISAGRAAMFVKICDYLHNISRPSQTPKKLLDKAISRGRLEYSRFVEEGHFGEQLHDVYFRRIAETERERSKLSEGSTNDNIGPSSLDDAITRSYSLVRNKVLELHDIIDALTRIFNPIACSYERIEDFINQHFGEPEISSSERTLLTKSLLEGHLILSKNKRSRQVETLSNIGHVFAVPLNVKAAGDEERRLVIAFSDTFDRSWVNYNAIATIVLVLSERLRAQVNRRTSELSQELKHIGLDLNPSLAIRSNMTFEQFTALKALMIAANFVHDILRSSINQATTLGPVDLGIERIESRVKSVDSIVDKLITRRFKDIYEVDDIVGLRVICLSPENAAAIDNQIMVSLKTDGQASILIASMIDGAVDSEDITSTVGYRAKHIRFKVSVPSQGRQLVRCEIQVRTIFQDAWARASHTVFYKRQRRRIKNENLLAELSNLCLNADGLVNKL